MSAAKKASKTRAKTSPKTSGAVVRRAQPHGGALNTGNPGNKGGPGRPPDALRALSRDAFAGVLREIGRRIDADLLTSADLGELSNLLDKTGKYGLGTRDELTVVSPDVQARVQRMVDVIASRPTWDSAALLTELAHVFKP